MAIISRCCSSCWFLFVHSWLCSREGDSPHAWCIFDACDGEPFLNPGSAAAWEGLTFVAVARAKMEVQFSGDVHTSASFWSGLGALHLKGRFPRSPLYELLTTCLFAPNVWSNSSSVCLEFTNTALCYMLLFTCHLHTLPHTAASLMEAFSFNSGALGSSGAAPCHSGIERTLLRWVIGREPHLSRFQWSFRGQWPINQWRDSERTDVPVPSSFLTEKSLANQNAHSNLHST